ncbi:MAG: hypothetical protein LBS01_11320 [Prevotellaceae bacterium]|nr:hypothetical protein [Prevotellaceae bacterium]
MAAQAELYQNAPNPFSENTEIGFYLPQTVSKAILCIYDMNGRQLWQTAKSTAQECICIL